MNQRDLWERYKQGLCVSDSIGITVDVSRMDFPTGFVDEMKPRLAKAFAAMKDLEGGAIANPDENRMVGHYWLRDSSLAPDEGIRAAIDGTNAAIRDFAAALHAGTIAPEKADRFRYHLVVGIGGSALGPQFVSDALTTPADPMRPFFFDNTDPDGIDRTLGEIGDRLAETLTIVISKSGGTKETRNGMLEAEAAYKARGLDFAKHAVAVTGEGSQLDEHATSQGWLRRFPMWDWVGGRTSELSAVGILPARLQGFDVDAILAGAKATDAVTREPDVTKNPAALLALAWYHAGGGKGSRDMVILPYKDRLMLLSKYLQQLVMESLGKELDLDGKVTNAGIAVYGNKGSTDQHAYVQQLREGVHNFFVTFIQVLKDREGASMAVEPKVTSGDYLLGFLLGTRRALHEKGRQSVTITVEELGPETIGKIVALYERAVGLYASLVNINAYHQPGVEAGKAAAATVLDLQAKVLAQLSGTGQTAEEVATGIGAADEVETVFKILQHLAANPDHGLTSSAGPTIFDTRYSA